MFWRRGRRGEEETQEPGSGRSRDEIEAELAADAEPADFDAASSGGEEIEFEEDEIDPDDAPLDEGDDEDEDGDEDDEALDDDLDDLADEDGPIDAEELTPEEIEAQAREFMADNDTWMYGENAKAVIALLDRLEDVDPYQAEYLLGVWKDLPKGEREVARKAIRRLVENDPEIERQVRLAREAVGNWLAVTTDDLTYQAVDAAWARHANGVADAALDAASALVVQSELDDFDFDVLHEPWVQAIAAWEAEAAANEAATEGATDGAAGEAGEADATAEGSPEGGSATSTGSAEPATGKEVEFGPNTREVKELLSRLWLLPPEQVSRLVSNWEQTPRDELQDAHAALKQLVHEDSEYRRDVRRAQEKLQPWLNSGRRDDTSAYLGRTGAADTHRVAGPALADAIAALVLGDLLDRTAAETLYAPWFKLVGSPALPEPAPLEGSEAAEANDDETVETDE